jgi:hypothetical protein
MANDRDSKGDKRDDAKDDINFGSNENPSGGPKVTDTIKKLVTAGVSAAFMTEESIRTFVSDLKLPKETLNLLVQGASKSKDELMNRVSREVIGIISKIDFVKEASRFVEEHKFKITAEIDVIKKENGSREPTVEMKIDPTSKSEVKT